MKSTDIKNIFFRNNGVNALYQGINLIWKKEENIDSDDYIPKNFLSGRFIDEVPESEKVVYGDNSPDSSGQSKVKFSIANYVDKETMIFDVPYKFFENINSSTNYGEKLKMSIGYLFKDNKYIKNIYKIPITTDTHKVTGCFYGAVGLESINFGNADFSNVIYSDYLFEQLWSLSEGYKSYDKLTTIKGNIKGIKFDLNLQYLTVLTNESAMVFINGLSEDIEDTRTITFNKNTFDTLTEEQIALATAKGWSVARR